MTTKIRRNTFETNSSSSHSITIVNTGQLISPTQEWQGETLVLEPKQEHGYMDAEALGNGDWYDRACYCAWLLDGWPEHNEWLEIFKEVFQEVLGTTDVEIKLGNLLAHQEGTLGGETEMLFSSKENVKNFIFNPDSSIRVDY